jgi:antagonist of KipI
MSLTILEPGLCTLVVDAGRPHHRSLGVPVGGAADRFSFALGNGLVGNPPDAPALEITLAGPTLRAECDLACVVFGAPFHLTITSAVQKESLTPATARNLQSGKTKRGKQRRPGYRNKTAAEPTLTPISRRVAAGRTFTLRAGEILRIGGTAARIRAYLCIRGGIDAPVILGSRSGLQPLRAGERLSCKPGILRTRWIEPVVGAGDPILLRTLEGAQADWFRSQDWSRQIFTVTPASNRMGLRLQGEPLKLPARELVSEPVCPGTVQVTRDGQCIILGMDGQTIGGYPKLAHVIQADLDQLGQLRPGDRLQLVPVTLGEAEEAERRRRAVLREWLTRLAVTNNNSLRQE